MPSNQFVFVNFSEDRTVLAGGNPLGQTNCLLTINSGTHTFTLSDPQNYQPASLRRKVANTSVDQALQISFTIASPAEPTPSPDQPAPGPDSTPADT